MLDKSEVSPGGSGCRDVFLSRSLRKEGRRRELGGGQRVGSVLLAEDTAERP